MVLLAGLQPSVDALLWLIDIAVRACCPGQVGAAAARLCVLAKQGEQLLDIVKRHRPAARRIVLRWPRQLLLRPVRCSLLFLVLAGGY
ncbi:MULTISPECIES: hypothetical protein [Bradyrhizobium]|jgi:shikimate 5-dehydrogenase|uniref:hypothetical protein n=1 Tax=Bradyrhizobium TaxID=374 RepID=UPI0003A44DA2|nr:hypothetical protein [Bradyrhizobium denitrificans]MCL8485573.1 hypothetical protein [Bradyrhizobium denitrificans]